jgi:hypothetical protein
MDKIKKILIGDLGIFLYKILNDILLLLIISYAMLLISEGAMPGLVSAHLSFTRLTLIIFVILGMIIYLGKINEINFKIENKKTALFGGLVIFYAVLIINSLLKFAWWEIGVITIASVALLYYLYKNFIES